MAGHGELLATTHAAGFDEDDVTANGGPDKTDRNPRFLNALFDFLFGAILRDAEELAHNLWSHNHFLGLAFSQATRLLANQSSDFPLQVAHARFPRIAVNDLLQPRFGEFELLAFLDPVFCCLLGDQVLARNVNLLFAGVAGELDDLHAIEEWPWNGIHPVGRGDEDDLRQIERHIEIVIAERGVLFRVEHFHECRGRITTEVTAQFVYFVEHADGVVGFSAFEALNNLAG